MCSNDPLNSLTSLNPSALSKVRSCITKQELLTVLYYQTNKIEHTLKNLFSQIAAKAKLKNDYASTNQ
jgi:hypothetical protein